jgi:flagellar biosynthesis GTPase FlhF
MSNNTRPISIAASFFFATALILGASPVMAQRPASGQGEPQRPPPAPPPPATRPQTPPPPPPDTRREENARAQQQREANARAQQQQDQQRAEKARQEQAARDQARIARARQESTSADPKYRDTIGRLIAAERVHRQQLASINRLKQIAQRQEQTERIRELDHLLQGSNSNFERQLSAAKAELPEDQYNNTVKMLEQGRRREVKQMMGQSGDSPGTGRTPPADGTRPVERTPVPSRQKPQEPTRPPH